MTQTREHIAAAARERIAAEVRAELARQQKPHGFLADVLRLHKSAVSHRLNGKTAFRVDELTAIAEALGVPAAQFYGERAA